MVAANNNRLDGKTTIQKLVYFAEKLKLPLEHLPTYRPHFFGPYSAEVDFQLDKLVALGFLEANARPTVNERLMYSYKLTPAGRQILKSIRSKDTKAEKAVNDLINRVREANALHPSTLSYAAKVFHICTSSKNSMTFNQVREEAEDFGWQITAKDIQTGVDLLASLKLVKSRK